MKKLALFVAALAVVPAMFAASAFADSPGQLSNGPDNYKVRNVTKNGAYGRSTSVTCDETVKYSITLANSDFGLLKDLRVKANLASGAISASATNAADKTTSVSGSVNVSVAKGTLKYVPGSTVRVASDNSSRTSVADGITAGGVNVGELKGSTQTFVQFEAKVDCPTTPEDKDMTVCRLEDKKVVTIKESEYQANPSKYSKNLADCAETPAGPGEMTVCEVETGNIVTIKEDDFDSSMHTENLADCEETDVPVATELPQTGANGIAAGLGLSVLAAGVAYALQRRNTLG